MRIIGGTYRGKKLFSPTSGEVRPTADRARESVFNIINSKIGGVWADFRLLELFAGTGAFAFEALSRGVSEVCLVDIAPENARRNAGLFPKEKDKIRIIKGEASKLPAPVKKYNFLFSDAPYNKGLSVPALTAASGKGWLEDGALCVVEIEKNEAFEVPGGFELIDERTYGVARFLFLRYLSNL